MIVELGARASIAVRGVPPSNPGAGLHWRSARRWCSLAEDAKKPGAPPRWRVGVISPFNSRSVDQSVARLASQAVVVKPPETPGSRRPHRSSRRGPARRTPESLVTDIAEIATGHKTPCQGHIFAGPTGGRHVGAVRRLQALHPGVEWKPARRPANRDSTRRGRRRLAVRFRGICMAAPHLVDRRAPEFTGSSPRVASRWRSARPRSLAPSSSFRRSLTGWWTGLPKGHGPGRGAIRLESQLF